MYRKTNIACAALLCMVAGAAPAQTRSPDNTNRPLTTPDNQRDHSAFTQDLQSGQWLRGQSELTQQGIASLPKARAALAKEWQRLGVPPQRAQEIAAAFRSDVPAFAHKSLRGKSAGDIALMIQTALQTKNYRQANQLLIEFERAQLRLDPMKPDAPES